MRALRILFYAGYGLLATVFLAAYTAAFVQPGGPFWWLGLLAVGIPYLSAALVLATPFVLALRRSRVLVAVHALALLCVAVRFVTLERLLPGPAPAGDPLTVMSFNVPRWWGGDPEAKTRGLEQLVADVAPDLVCLQEAWVALRPGRLDATEHVVPLIRRLGLRPGPLVPANLEIYLPVLGQGVEVIEQRRVELPVPPGEVHAPEVVRVHFRWQGREAVLYNVHLRSFGSDKPWRADEAHLFDVGFWRGYARQYRRAYRARAFEALHIRTLLDAETLPLIVAGDFNSTMHNWEFRHLRGGLRDAFGVAGTGWGATFHSRLRFARIDHVLVSREWAVTRAVVPQVRVSDHLPLVAYLRWRDG